MQVRWVVGVIAVSASLALAGLQHAFACQFCGSVPPTFSELMTESDAVSLVHWFDARTARDQDPGETVYQVVQTLKSPHDSVKKGDRIKLPRFRAGKKGDLFLLTGMKQEKGTAIEWAVATEISPAGSQYITQAPPRNEPAEKRLAYYFEFLEHPETAIANDAYGEFATAPYKDVASVASRLPREKIRGWITKSATPQTRLGLYGMLLGLCGNNDDAKLLGERIAPNAGDGIFRIGLDGMIGGYLLLAGDKALDDIDRWKFKPEAKAEFSEIYASMQALRFVWQYAGDKLDKDRMRQSMRLLLDRPEVADLAIYDLARMGDWSVQEKLMGFYGKGAYDNRAMKQAIVRYMLASTRIKPADAKAADRAKSGQAHLEELRKKDPKSVQDAERFFLQSTPRPGWFLDERHREWFKC